MSRECRRRAIRGCARRCSKSPGCGCSSALARWYHARVGERPTKARKKTAIVALARKLLVALWKYVRFGEVIEGAIMTPAA